MNPAATPRCAYIIHPHAGGVFTLYVALRKALLARGITLDWAGPCYSPEVVLNDPHFASYRAAGHPVNSRGKEQAAVGAALLQILQDYNLVFVNVLTSPAEMSVAAYLPEHVQRVLIVHNITPGTYQAARACRPFVHATVCVSPRIREELIASHGFLAEATFAIPNAMEISPAPAVAPAPVSPHKLLFVGRIVDIDKGVFWLPSILARLPEEFRLTIAGEGPDLARLKALCRPLGSRVEFLGRVEAASVHGLAASHGILLFTSRFEGFGFTLIEAMAQGCVPVAAAIRGVTDFVVRHEQTGLMVPIGNVRAFADATQRLAADPALHARLSAAGRQDVAERFSIEAMTQHYEPVLQWLASGRATAATRHGQPFEVLRQGGQWRRFVPRGVKNLLRRYL